MVDLEVVVYRQLLGGGGGLGGVCVCVGGGGIGGNWEVVVDW